jgi:dihydroxyacetone kinase
MLAAAMSGGFLSTSSQAQIEVALTKVDAKHGILAIIMNHRVIHCSSSYLINFMTSNQGNITNFKAAISKFKTSGIRTELVVVGDGVGRGRIRAQKHEGSGIAGTVLVLKVAGAFAATG